VVLLLALRYSRELVVKLVPRLLGASPAQRLHALEILDDLLDPRLRSMCFPLLDDLAPGDRLERLPLPDLPEKRPPGRWLHALLSGEAKGLGTWTHAAALDVARQRQETTVIEATRTYLGSRLPILRETALATLAVLDPKLAQEAATEALSDRAPEVHQLARGILQEANA
jgi:hypothetical protein